MYKNYDEFHPQGLSVPEHIAIIPDGGRRWAKNENCSDYSSYRLMCDKLYEYSIYLYNNGVKTISVYFSSSQNFRRVKTEIESFCRAEAEFMEIYAPKLLSEYGTAVEVVGRRDNLPEYMVRAIEGIAKPAQRTKRKMYLCVNYNPHDEINQAVLKAQENNGFYVNFLYIKEPVDVLIRTGGASVTSNFLMAQTGFARLFFIEKLFNDMGMEDIERILKEYSGYELKYGN